MTEFRDFLKRKYAYVAIGEFKPGKFEEAKHLYEKAIATYGQGFGGSYLLQEPGTDKGIAIIFWSSVEEMEANKNEVHQAIVKEISHLLVEPATTSVYEVCGTFDPPASQSEA